MAMVCAMSVFNGFTQIAEKSFDAFDPQLQISAAKGKVFDPDTEVFSKISRLSQIEIISPVIEENALLKFQERQVPVTVRGVSSNFSELTDIEKLIIDGEFKVKDGDIYYGVLGAGLAMNLGVRAYFTDPLEIYAPKRNIKINLANPSSAFTTSYAMPEGIFLLNQQKYDDQLFFISIEQARELFRYEKEVTSLDIKLKNGASVSGTKREIEKALGDQYIVKDRFQQQEESYKMVNIEKWVTFLILVFILVIAIFNIIGSLSMLILDKDEDIKILQNLGAGNNLISKIFLFEGWLISLSGALIGLFLGLILCLLQQHFGLLKLGQSPGAFIVDAYPVRVFATDIIAIFVTVSLIAIVAVLYPINNLRKRLNRMSAK